MLEYWNVTINLNTQIVFVTDLAANSTRMMEINNECDQLIKANHIQSAVIKRKQKQLNDQLVVVTVLSIATLLKD